LVKTTGDQRSEKKGNHPNLTGQRGIYGDTFETTPHCQTSIVHRTKALWARELLGKKMASIFAQSFSCSKTAYFCNAARTVRSPVFLGLALQRAVVVER
jgi:hypothetical protein